MKLLKLIPDNTNIDFMRWRNVALVISILLTVAGLVLVGVRGLNLGIDFVGGQVVQVNFAQPVNTEDLRARIAGLRVGDATIQEFGDDRTYQIRLPKPDGPEAAAPAVVTKVRAFVPQAYPGAVVSAGESVSGKVSEELASDGAFAIALAILGRNLHLVSFRMAIWRRCASDAVPRRLSDLRLLRAFPEVPGRSQYRRSLPRRGWLFA